MQYQLERLENIAHSQTLLSELFIFIGENADRNAYLSERPEMLFRLWGGNDPMLKLKVFTARDDEQKLQGVVMVMTVENPLFLAKPFIHRLVDLTQNDHAFADYVDTVMGAL